MRRGYVHGKTTNELMQREKDPLSGVENAVRIEDLHATLLHSFGLDFTQELQTPIGRPLAISQGNIIKDLLQV